jgi:HSP20 family protein
MALVRWQPFREIESMQRQMDRLFDSMTSTGEGSFNGGISFMPAVEMNETSDAIHLKLEVPGLEAKDLDVQVTKEAVSISGERKSESKTEENGVTRSEFRYGSFRRVIPLPAQIQNDKVEAEFKNGVLTLNLPKAEEEKNKVVKVNLGQL